MHKTSPCALLLGFALLGTGCDQPTPPMSSESVVPSPDSSLVAARDSAPSIEPSRPGTYEYRYEYVHADLWGRDSVTGSVTLVHSTDHSTSGSFRFKHLHAPDWGTPFDTTTLDTTIAIDSLAKAIPYPFNDFHGDHYSDNSSFRLSDTLVTIHGALMSGTIVEYLGVTSAHQRTVPGLGSIEASFENVLLKFQSRTIWKFQLVSIDGNPI